MRSFEEDLDAAVAFHGHLCDGQILGVRMARLGLGLMGITEPRQYKDLIVYVEADRCLADAICSVTGCNLGRRRLKLKDYGKMAATFVDLATNKAVRISPSGKQKDPGPQESRLEFWQKQKDLDIFKVEQVSVDVPLEDRPGKPTHKVICSKCGERIMDRREVITDGKPFCRACAGGAYYTLI